MKRTLIIGGSPCSGKSTLSNYLSEKLGYQVINVDDYMDKHIEEADDKRQPIMYQWKTEPWHNLFSRDVDVLLSEEIKFYEEEWEFLRRDINNDIENDTIIIEGCALLPSLAATFLRDVDVLYMVPTEAFQKEKYRLRDWAFEIVKDAENPQDAFDNWMDRDVEFAKFVAENAKSKGYKVIVVDGTKTVEQIATEVIDYYKL